MVKFSRRIAALLLFLLLAAQIANATPAATVQNMRSSQSSEKIRIVLDVTSLPEYNVRLEQDPLRLIIEFSGALDKNLMRQTIFNDEYVNSVKITEVSPGKLQAVIDLKKTVVYKVFTLASPNRLVIDINKTYEQKIQQEIAPGLKYTTWYRSTKAGPTAAYILDIAPQASYMLKPILSNDAIADLETVGSMAGRTHAIAAVNGSYFGLDGAILGLLKVNGQIVSVPDQPRTAFGILPNGNIIMDRIDYNGSAKLPDGHTVAITGVNCERGPNDLILYNDYFDNSTNTNEFGIEYVITSGKVTAINPSNSPLSSGSIVLSAHGTSAAALNNLKIGDTVQIMQTLGTTWDNTVYALGAGPRLVQNGNVFLTTTLEQFGSDVAGGRAPRTALGTTKDGHILLVVVDGRQKHSIGMTLYEMAAFMRELGAVDAMNLDGGGSSEMVVNGEVVNSPSDGHERRVGDALIIVPKATVAQ